VVLVISAALPVEILGTLPIVMQPVRELSSGYYASRPRPDSGTLGGQTAKPETLVIPIAKAVCNIESDDVRRGLA